MTTKRQFNVGDVVHLITGSPPMVVIKYDGYGATNAPPIYADQVAVIWFDEQSVCHERSFPGAVLK